jgi:hypothetical protein
MVFNRAMSVDANSEQVCRFHGNQIGKREDFSMTPPVISAKLSCWVKRSSIVDKVMTSLLSG